MAAPTSSAASADSPAGHTGTLGAPSPSSGDGSAGNDDLGRHMSRPPLTANQAGPRQEPAPDGPADRSEAGPQRRTAVRTWPLLVLALPASIAVWSGWIGIGQMTGFGEIRPLPGIWNSLRLDTAVTLPVGVEAYAAFALHAWLTSNPAISDRTRRFARWSAIAAMILGMSGQVAYHLLNQAGTTRAPWEVTTLVACLPVAVLGMGSALAHLLRSDTAPAKLHGAEARHQRRPLTPAHCADSHAAEGSALGSRMSPESTLITMLSCPLPESKDAFPGHKADLTDGDDPAHQIRRGGDRLPARVRLKDTEAAVTRVVVAGKPISRRSLRSAGWPNAMDLSALA